MMDSTSSTPQKSSSSYLSGFTLVNFLRYVEAEVKSWTLKVFLDNDIGYLFFRDGILINAKTEKLKGEEAAIDILCWENPKITILNKCFEENITINLSLDFLILEACRRIDENTTEFSNGNSLSRAISLAEKHQFKEALELLKNYLKKHPKDSTAWLWYSRCTTNKKAIRAALKNAALISPSDHEIDEEREKLVTFEKMGYTGKIRRCPICWSLIELKAFQCHYCSGYLYIPNERSFPSIDDNKFNLYEEAIERYKSITNSEDNAFAAFCQSISYYNIKRIKDAVESLQQAMKFAPDKKFFSDQFNLLEHNMISRSTPSPFDNFVNSDQISTEEVTEEDISSRKKVLVVEDSPTTRNVISTFLEDNGFFVIEAEDGFQALSKLNEAEPDLVLLDIILPKMDGYKILAIIRDSDEFRNVPVILLTSKDGILSKMKGKLAGSTAYHTKPFNPDGLLKTINKYI